MHNHSHNHGHAHSAHSHSHSGTEEENLKLLVIGEDKEVVETSISKTDIDKAQRKLIIASTICIFFMIAEVIGGYIAGSLAIMTDAAHLLSDVAGFFVSLFCLVLAKRGSTPSLSYGFKRAEVLGALLSVLFIWFVTGILLYEAVMRTYNITHHMQESTTDGKTMFIVACAGLFCNTLILNVLGHGHSHGGEGGGHGHSHESHGHSHESHGHSHEEPEAALQEGKKSYGSISSNTSHHNHKENNINIQAAYIHVIGDIIQSVGVCIAGAIIWHYPAEKYPMAQLADPFATYLFSVLVLYQTLMVLNTSLGILMEGVPKNIDPLTIESGLLKVDGVLELHDLHIWSLTVGEPSLSVHLVIREDHTSDSVLKETQHFLRKVNILHSTVQIEVANVEFCKHMQCNDCESYAIDCKETECHVYS